MVLVTGFARAGLGAVALSVPRLPLLPWVGAGEAGRPTALLLARALGGRDLAIGVGTVLALRHGGPVRGWVEAGGLADLGDVVATVAAWRRLPRLGRWAVAGAAAGGVLAARLTAGAVDVPEAGHPVGG
ncbi:MAG: hypothetical protein ACYC1D_04370 [Acidimicrobiales bacterium]